MHYRCIFVLSVLVTVLLSDLAHLLSLHWGDIHTKVSWDAVPKDWGSPSCPLTSTNIDLSDSLA